MKFFQRITQIIATIAYNGYIPGFLSGSLYQGAIKYLPCPGLNCYSCPGAFMSCPIGGLQLFITYGRFHISFYLMGFLSAIGAVAGRIVCGWACPFGFMQDMLYAIPSPKIPVPRLMQYLRYAVLCGVVVGIGWTTQEPWFCKLCPTGTLEAGFPMLALNAYLREHIGTLFYIKIGIFAALLGWMMLSKRPFCRIICPLGTIYSFFNRVSILHVSVDSSKCTRCGTCIRECPMDIAVYNGGPLSSQCIRCFRCTRCPSHAVALRWFQRPASRS